MEAKHKIDSLVDADFGKSRVLKGCTVAGIRFTGDGKVSYDLLLDVTDSSTLIQGVDSVFVFDPA